MIRPFRFVLPYHSLGCTLSSHRSPRVKPQRRRNESPVVKKPSKKIEEQRAGPLVRHSRPSSSILAFVIRFFFSRVRNGRYRGMPAILGRRKAVCSMSTILYLSSVIVQLPGRSSKPVNVLSFAGMRIWRGLYSFLRLSMFTRPIFRRSLALQLLHKLLFELSYESLPLRLISLEHYLIALTQSQLILGRRSRDLG